MSEKLTDSRMRIQLAQFCFANSIAVDELYAALGVDMSTADAEVLAHMAGIIDGMTVAANRIRQHGLDNWASQN
ncbi:hypothetical protein PB2503_03322 [Parvularcula bermudensis HTCC2503]|uniref:Uncharacterized protein n=1 Tax=Parvularcula bermudensis (strain ATCC BAA-594 / HTCC2503 / KCTC 12087) TaxID=314260 RepID=E0TDI5_PARBH|nr:hypothetical protein [Parvularcula bermudensis]ADM08740.1 hypothetical protein PB2503_03322 [Parvularcula bermudensis HTCC2503]